MSTEIQNAVEKFLSEKPYFGKSDYRDKDLVKMLSHGEGETGWKAVRWNTSAKLWGTTEMASIPRLLASGKWAPIGILPEWYPALSQAAKAKSFFTSKVKTEKQMAAKNEENEQELRDALEQRKLRETARAADVKFKSMVSATDAEIARATELGFDEGVGEYAISMEVTFGPVSGMSSIGRVLRWFDLKLSEARAEAYLKTGASWMTPKDLEPYYAAARDRWVKRLNSAAKQGDRTFDGPKVKRTTKRERYEDVYIALDTPDVASAVTTPKLGYVKDTPSCALYVSYCSSCSGTVNSQFRECFCSSSWVSCHGCQMWVARHQPCRFKHAVEYPAEADQLFLPPPA